ncbi:MAG: molybdenum cofactor guanylyltransferase [Desulfovibrionaceae bacterium]|nr:molybdenum cofactor guanylyltransferase [Desulfovibrionaceae bacterium]MBF0514645.1 molybdenum cofactor guanylyltransferase [Desulfovibrionaceae bacterium]
MPGDDLAAVILAGGESTRLGRDKALIAVGGVTLLARTAALAARVCREVYVSGRDPGNCLPQVAWFADATPRIGPMGGIMTALTVLARPVLALPCDLPLLTEPVLARLISRRDRRAKDAVMTVYLHPETGYIESLAAIYEPAALGYLRGAAAMGMYKLSRAIPEEARNHVPCRPGEAAVFFNVNRPEDLDRLDDDSLGACAPGQ